MTSTGENGSEWLTVQEYARHFRVAPRTVLRWVASDPAMKVKRIGPSGRTIRIHISELNRENTVSPAA